MSQRDELHVLCWGGYDSPGLLEPFARSHGVTAVAETFLSDRAAADRILRQERAWDVLNVNSPFVRDALDPGGLVSPLDPVRFAGAYDRLLPQFERLYRWGRSADGARILGICQRFGTFNLVVHTGRIARATAEAEGFDLASDTAHAGRFGILAYDDFNCMHVAIGARLNPFVSLDEAALDRFARTADAWHKAARIVTDDHDALNRALLAGEIDFYVGGGGYTVASARLAGHRELRAVTPRRGPIDGKGAIVFMEVTAVLTGGNAPRAAEDFLDYLTTPSAALAIGTGGGACDPVAQMGDPRVMAGYSRNQLDALQWETLEEDIARCADYALMPDYPAMLARINAARRRRAQRLNSRGPDRPGSSSAAY